MARDIRILFRIGCAFAIGAIFDLFVFRDAYPYGHRNWFGDQTGVTVFWVAVAFVFVSAFLLNFRMRPSRGAVSSAPPRGTIGESLDSHGLLIPFVMLLGLTVAHTIVLIRDVTIDPTTHNLMPFEYLIVWFVVGIPALFGSLLARILSWMRNRVEAR